MSEATATDADEALLDELAGLLMSAARMAHERMAKAQDEAAFHAAGQTLHRMARSLRQTLALKQRARREADQSRQEAEMQASNRRIEQVIRREVIKAAVERIYWTEHEALDADDDAADALLDAIAEHCEAATLDPDFLDLPIAAQVARICQAAGLPVPKAADETPTDPPPSDAPWRNSG
jgi:hypothetical protein